MSTLHTLRMYGRFMVGLPAFLRRRLSLDEAEAAIRAGLDHRNENFLRIARRGIYEYQDSPYRALLQLAGCTYADLEASVMTRGLETTLEALRAEGVYVTFEEYKGHTPLVRRGQTIPTDVHAFDNPLRVADYEAETGGSTGRAARVGTDLDNIWAQAPHMMVIRHMNNLIGAPTAVWKGALPDPVGLEIFLRSVVYDRPPDRWYTPVTDDHRKPPLRFRLANHYVLVVSRLYGVPCPRPEPLPLNQAIVLARWAADALRQHGRCQVVASVSLAVRICLAAREADIDLTGAVFFGGGEPFTPAKRAAIEAVGARHVTVYVSVDAGPMGLPCASPVEENDQHLLEDNLALIQYPRAIDEAGLTVDAFYFTSLRPDSSKLLFNMESDDYGVVEDRACGCPLEALGYRRHLRRIRSFGKLTGEGVTLVGSEMVRVLEEVLPNRFGGGPQDYQLLEEEDERGLTRLVLLVTPSLQIPDDQVLVDAMLEAVGEGSLAGDIAQAYWRQAGTIRVRRQAPRWTSRGKLPSLRVGSGR